MSWFTFLITRTVKNGILKVVKKPSALIGYLFLILIFGFNIFNSARTASMGSNFQVARIVYLGLMILLAYTTVIVPIYSGTKKFGLRYLPADGIYLMAAPVKPLPILWYAQIKQSLISILVSFFMIIQAPMLVTMVGLNARGVMLFILGFFVMSLIPNVLTLCTFTIGLRNDNIKLMTRYCAVIIGAIGILVILMPLFQNGSFVENALNGLTSNYWLFVPIIGWIYSIFIASIVGQVTTVTLISFVLLGLTCVLALILIRKNADEQYYEEALNTAEIVNTIRRSMKNGKSQMEAAMSIKKVKARRVKNTFKRSGILAVFDKQVLMTRKKGISWLDFQSVAVIGIIVSVMYFAQTIQDMKEAGIFLTLGILGYVLFLFQLVKTGGDDMERHYLYMLPYSSISKLFALSLWSLIKLIMEATIGFVIASFMTPYSLFECLLAGVCVGLVGYMFYLISTLSVLVFGNTGTLVLRMMIRMILDILLIGIIAVVFALVIGINIDTRLALGLGVADLVIAGLCALLLLPASIIVNKPEFNK